MNAWQKSSICPFALSFLLVCIASARADVQFSGTEDHVVLQAKNATLAEVLSGIRSAFNLRVGLTGSTERQFTGAYTGTLRRVLSRLLDGEDYVISSAPDGMNIVLLGPKGAGRNIPPPIGPVKHTNGEQTLRLAAAIDDEGNPNYQGWMPDRNPHKAASVKDDPVVSATVVPAGSSTEGEGNQNYQGWLPTGNLPKTANVNGSLSESNTSATASAAFRGDEGNPIFQGWLATGNLLKTATNSGGPFEGNSSATAPAASSTEDEGNPDYQGWVPSGNSALTRVPATPL